jgi:hypothetical protein
MPQIDTDTPFTQNLLRTLVATIPAQPDETEAEYKERFAAATTAWAACRPRDTVEQMLAAQQSALGCLAQAAETEDSATADKLRRSHATMTRSARDGMRQLERRQERPADTEPLPAIEPISQPRRRPAEQNATHYPMQSEKPRTEPRKDPAKMSDEALETAKNEIRTLCVTALFDKKHPLHLEALRTQPDILPGLVVPDALREDALPMTA